MLSQTAWANALIGRIFWDFLREKHWVNVVSHKIQKKLSKIRVRSSTHAAVASSQRKFKPDKHFTAFKMLICCICAAALLYEWTESDWVGYGMFHASNHFNLKTWSQPARWAQWSFGKIYKHWLTRRPMSNVITCEVYVAIRCCYPSVISKCTATVCPGFLNVEAYCACLTVKCHSRRGFIHLNFR